MTMVRDTAMLDNNNMPIMAAEAMIPHHAKMVSGASVGWITWSAIDFRAYWESGYAAGLDIAGENEALRGRLLASEQRILSQQETIETMRAERIELLTAVNKLMRTHEKIGPSSSNPFLGSIVDCKCSACEFARAAIAKVY